MEKLGGAVRDALKSPEIQDRLAQLGLEVRASTPAEMGDIVRSQYNTWGPIVKASGFTADE